MARKQTMKYLNQRKVKSIKLWAVEERPREKMEMRGRKHLSDAELLGIIIGTGSHEESAVDLARRLLMTNNQNLNQVAKLSIKELQQYRGIGPAKAISIAAALELSLRRVSKPLRVKPQITQSSDAYDVLKADLMDLPHEEFVVLLLNQANRVIDKKIISVGGIAGTVVDVKKIFRTAP